MTGLTRYRLNRQQHGIRSRRALTGRPAVEPMEPRRLMAYVSIGDAAVLEGNTGTTAAVFAVTVHDMSDQVVTVNYATTDFTARAPGDYAPTSGTLTFNPGGPTTQNVTVNVAADTEQENNETFNVGLSSPVNVTIVAQSATGTILDDDEVRLTVPDIAVVEGDTGTTAATLTVTRHGSTAGTSSVQWSTQPFTATSPADYATASGTLTFAPGETTKTVTVQVNNDALQENTESFSVSFSSPVSATVIDPSVTVTVVDNDASTVTVESAVFGEGDTDPAGMTFNVRRHGSLVGPASFTYSTRNFTALAGSDYESVNGTVNFAPGETTKQIVVPVRGDFLQESTESFSISLTGPENTTLAETSVDGTIVDNDASAIVVRGGAVAEGDTGTTPLVFTITRYGKTGGAATVNYATANFTAQSPADYEPASGSVTFAPGETVKTVTVNVNGDTSQENEEIFTLSISAPTNGTIAENSAQGVIVDDDESFLAIVPTAAHVTEGNAGTSQATFTVFRYGSLDGPASVNYTTAAFTATTPADFASTSGTLNFAAGETSKTITVGVVGDTDVENNEQFNVNLSAPQNATIADSSAPGWIINDDGAVGTFYFISPAVVAEGDSGTTPATFTVRRTGNLTGAGSVNYTATPPAGSGDFQPASGTLIFAADETEKTFTVNVNGDAVDENTETFNVSLTAPVGGLLAGVSGNLVVVDDDTIVIYIDDASMVEGDDPAGTDLRFNVRRFGDTGGQTTVNYATANGSATTPQDFQPASGTVSFNAGEDTKEITVRVLGDARQEGSFGGEQFTVNLTSPINGSVVAGGATGTVADDDGAFFAVGDASVLEGTGGAAPELAFVVRRFGSTDGTATVNFATTNFTATAQDFSAANGTLTFAPGETEKTVLVPVTPDALQEAAGGESFFLDLSAADNATIAESRAEGTIVEDDLSFFTLGSPDVVEGDSGTRDATFTITRHGSTAGTSSVEFRAANFTARSPEDYTPVTQTVTFAPGETTKTVVVPVVGDAVQEPDESFSASLASPTNGTVAGITQFPNILDNDQSFLLIDNVVVEEGDPGSPGSAVFTVRRVGSLVGQATVNFAAANFTATAPDDYQPTSGTLIFAPGEATKQITVPLTGDTTRENPEEFFVNLSAANNATVVDSQGRAVILDDDPPPAVTGVYVNGTGWAQAFRDELAEEGLGDATLGFLVPGGANQLLALPWSNANRVSIRFSADVSVQEDDLEIRSGANIAYGFAAGGFSYDATTRVATWTLNKSLADFTTTNRQTEDRVRLDLNGTGPDGVRGAGPGGQFLDGEWTDGSDAYPSGNGSPGGDFRFLINAVPGDANRNGNVSPTDYGTVRSGIGRNTTTDEGVAPNNYTVFKDINANGNVSPTDIGVVRGNTGANIANVTTPSSLEGTVSITEELFGTARIV